MLYIVRLEIVVPEELPADELDALKSSESARARELAVAGNLHRLWRDPSQWANWGLWEAHDESSLRECLASLPLWPYMTASIFPVVDHPSDPAKYNVTDQES
jgi:muconolactone D-isomerase